MKLRARFEAINAAFELSCLLSYFEWSACENFEEEVFDKFFAIFIEVSTKSATSLKSLKFLSSLVTFRLFYVFRKFFHTIFMSATSFPCFI
jgi:hypothetical protein